MRCNDCFLYVTLRCDLIEDDPNEIDNLDGMECNLCSDYISIKDKKREEKANKKTKE